MTTEDANVIESTNCRVSLPTITLAKASAGFRLVKLTAAFSSRASHTRIRCLVRDVNESIRRGEEVFLPPISAEDRGKTILLSEAQDAEIVGYFVYSVAALTGIVPKVRLRHV
jgi:hypothetical protein